MNAKQTPTPGPAEVWRAGSIKQRATVCRVFPALADALDSPNAAVGHIARAVEVWRCGSGGNYSPIADHFPALFEAMCRADDSGRADPYAPIETPTPAPAVEFRGLSDVVKVWRAATLPGQTAVGLNFPALAAILDRADEYMREVESQSAINECSPAPADDREPAHTVEVLDDMLRVATGQYQQMPADMFGRGDWLNVAAYFAADAVTEKTALTEANGVGAAAIIARNNCAAATAMATMFAHLAVAACAVEGVRRDG